MAYNIKGITIDIGGDFRDFDKGIKEAENRSRSLQNELKQIDKLLKFDPHNAVLLQQKFDVLTGKIQATKDKLKLLEDAQVEVERQFQDGEIDDGQYRAFQREVEDTKNILKHFEKEAENTKKDIDGLGDEADETGDEFAQMGRDAQSSSKKIDSGFNTTAINMSSVMNIVSRIGTLIQSAIEGAVNLGKKIAGIINDYYDAVDEINTNSKKYGISTDTYQKWRYASEIIDVSAETMGSALGKLTKQMSKDNSVFEELGISIYDASGNFRDSEDVFYDAVDALGKVEDETQADILANQLFGKSFQELEPLIDAGTDSLKDLGKEAEDRQVIMTPEELETMQGAKDALDKIKSQLEVALAPVIEAISPYIEKLATWLGEKLADPHVQEVIQKLADAFGQMAEAIADSLIDLVESGAIEDLIDTLIDFLPVMTEFIKTSLPALIEALKQMMGFIIGCAEATEDFDTKLSNLTDTELTFGTTGEYAGGLIKKAFTGGFDEIGKTIVKTLEGAGLDMDEFYKKVDEELGLIPGTAERTFGAIQIDWGETITGMWEKITGWYEYIKEVFAKIPETMQDYMGSFPEKVGGIFNSAWEKIKEWFDKIGKWFRELPDKIWNWIKSIPEKIKKAFSGQATVSANGIIGYHGQYAEGGIFKKSSFVNVGEDGPEVVLPLDKLGQVLGAVGYGNGVVVNAPVQVVKELNDGEIARVGNRLSTIVGREFAKRTGGVL